MVVFGQNGCSLAKVIVFGQCGCIWAEVVVFWQSVFYLAMWLYSGIVVVVGKSGCIHKG